MSNDNLTKALKIVLADSYTLYLKTHNYHWNVEGERFYSLHTFFQTQYEELAIAVDDIAETIRQLGQKAPGSFKLYKELANIKDGNENASANEMVKDLAKDQNIIMESITAALDLAQKVQDEATTDLLVQRLAVHRKAKWMLGTMA
ncbi:MAG: DNA starvation/stationary phase protection protein [Alphaproteobacteria bacterium]|nr:DNA starvation/stationary phase protection protein [Alphaproteobacteria bacterium]